MSLIRQYFNFKRTIDEVNKLSEPFLTSDEKISLLDKLLRLKSQIQQSYLTKNPYEIDEKILATTKEIVSLYESINQRHLNLGMNAIDSKLKQKFAAYLQEFQNVVLLNMKLEATKIQATQAFRLFTPIAQSNDCNDESDNHEIELPKQEYPQTGP